jgi:peptidylprolyl isomerase
MTKVKKDDKVQIHYKGTLTDGEVFDSSEGRDPLEFVVGSGQVIVGFDEAVIGMEVGEKKSVLIPCEKAYGERLKEMVIQVPVAQVPPDLDIEIGMMLEMGGAQGEILRVKVIEMDDDTITLDANPPLAGADLNFDIELVAIM